MKPFESLRIGGLVAAALIGSASFAADWTVPDIEKLPVDKYGQFVRLGRDYVQSTYNLLGPEAKNQAMRYAGNNLSCQSCHLDAATKQFGLPFVGVFADFPQYRPREDAVGTIEDRINGCMERSMNGRAMPLDSEPIRAMTAYLQFLSRGVAIGAQTPGRGSPNVTPLSRAADPERGRAVFAQSCASCHGADGLGVRKGKAGDGEGYAFPPVWGPDSYNSGAGMYRVMVAASFVKGNMPLGVSHATPALSDEQAFDVAAFINSQPRPAKANVDRDFPAGFNKPVDMPFPPFKDSFPAEQHKYGPFSPIIEARRAAAAR